MKQIRLNNGEVETIGKCIECPIYDKEYLECNWGMVYEHCLLEEYQEVSK